ncbi:prolactin-5A1-like [Nannospalax galili]|uniref:prolactin-5A1-like n=1 Tax=Nannospalax galili TaxID=1026970 RepID=UPI00111C6D3E|nr:prolactin-5A1-like [Nannospalax galili]
MQWNLAAMQLSLTGPCSSGTLLLLLLSNLLLWKDVASEPKRNFTDGSCEKILGYIFNLTDTLSEDINSLSSEMLNEFDKEYDEGQKFRNKASMTCHTYSLHLPNKKRYPERTQPDFLLKATMSMLSAWNNHLSQVVLRFHDLETTHHGIMSKFRVVDGKISKLRRYLKVVRTVLSQMANESSLPFAFHSLFVCLHSDATKVSDYINVLRCHMVSSTC